MKSTLTLFVAVFALLTSLFSPETAWAGKKTRGYVPPIGEFQQAVNTYGRTSGVRTGKADKAVYRRRGRDCGESNFADAEMINVAASGLGIVLDFAGGSGAGSVGTGFIGGVLSGQSTSAGEAKWRDCVRRDSIAAASQAGAQVAEGFAAEYGERLEYLEHRLGMVEEITVNLAESGAAARTFSPMLQFQLCPACNKKEEPAAPEKSISQAPGSIQKEAEEGVKAPVQQPPASEKKELETAPSKGSDEPWTPPREEFAAITPPKPMSADHLRPQKDINVGCFSCSTLIAPKK